MFAVASPGASAPGAIGKVMRLTSAWNAELELFHCVYDAALIGPGGFTSGSNEAAIRAFVEQRRRQLERVVEGATRRTVSRFARVFAGTTRRMRESFAKSSDTGPIC